jgi:hypothetical protein
VTRAARILFALLVVATAASFFVAQRLKNQPAVVQGVRFSGAFSPDGDGRRDRLAISFRVKRSQPVTAEMVDPGGQTVRTLVSDRDVKAYQRTSMVWDGKGDDGRVAPDGRYRLKVVLPDEGRSIIVQSRSVQLRTDPPKPRVVSVAVEGAEPGTGPASRRSSATCR